MSAALLVVAAVGAFFLLRPGVWARMFFSRVDPRPAALLRIAFGAAVLWSFLTLLPHVRLFFTDEGLLLPGMARETARSPLRELWDPVHGFEHWWSPLRALVGSSSILHLRSDPPLVFAIYALLLVCVALMSLGVWTRATSIASWVLAEQLYRYDSMFANGGDLVIRAFLFLGMFCQWGEAYGVDAWRRRRAELLGGSSRVPPLRRIPAWPLRLMMVQLTLIYFLNGWLKTGAAWRDGTALYYALNLDHFYRLPAQGVVTWLQYVGVLPILSWLTRWWELLFPLALLGVALRGYEADRRAGRWPPVGAGRRVASWLALAGGAITALSAREPALAGAVAIASALAVLLYRFLRARLPAIFRFVLTWALGKRVWLVVGVALHLGIDIGLNVGTFPQVMMAVYFAWLTGPEIDAFWRFMLRRAPPVIVRHHPDEASVRQAALLRLWEHAPRIEFAADPAVESRSLHVDLPDGAADLRGPAAALALVPLFPALWWLRPFRRIRVTQARAGRIALKVLGQKI
jgi:hypothetical protein